MPPADASLLDIWFGRATVTRGRYATTGFGLTALKYAVEATAVYWIFGAFFDPWMFLVASLEERRQLFGEHAGAVAAVWALWTIPFVWIAFSMSMRRAVHAGGSAWWSVLVFVPVVNLFAMLALAAVPERRKPELRTATAAAGNGPAASPRADFGSESGDAADDADDEEVPPPNIVRFAVGFALSLAVAGTMFGLAVYGVGQYGIALFFGTPMVMGMTIAVYTYDPGKTGCAPVLSNAVLAAVLALFSLLATGWEGAICLVMAAPIAIVLAALGALFGRTICESTRYPGRHLGVGVLALPALLALDANEAESPTLSVTTSIVIDAPIEKVWNNVVRFPDLPEPEEWYFRAGIAYPMRARIDGSGIGATRHCIFSTGTFVEPITVWDEPHHLAFDVREQPEPMFELSPYREVHAPHLEDTLRSVRGEFRLESLADGKTRLSGTTWYQFDMHPRAYWVLWSDWLIQAIHRRVLEHIRAVSE